MQQPDQIIRKIDLPESVIGLRKDGIVHVFYKAHTEITIEYQERQLKVFREITNGKPFPAIYEADEYVTVGKEARENAIRLEPLTPTLCKVVYVTNLAHKIISEFYFKFNKPAQPFRVFSSFEDGIAWLRKTAEYLSSHRP